MQDKISNIAKKVLNHFLFLTIVFILTDCKKKVQEPIETIKPLVKAYLLEMIDLMKKNSINRKKIDWETFTANVLKEAGYALNIVATEPAINLALTQLGDNHSFVQTNDNKYIFGNSTINYKSEYDYIDRNFKDIGYVKVTGNFMNSTSNMDLAKNIQDDIKAEDNDILIGWIVDLRGNGGGNMWPMLAGLGPILGNGLLGYFIDINNNELPWFYKNGISMAGNNHITIVYDYYVLKKDNPKVAVLINGSVASSGEAAAIAFKSRPNTKFFGTPTFGLSTANQNYTLSNNSILYLTVSTMADRNKNLYGNKVEPDELTKTAVETNAEAIKWLRQ